MHIVAHTGVVSTGMDLGGAALGSTSLMRVGLVGGSSHAATGSFIGVGLGVHGLASRTVETRTAETFKATTLTVEHVVGRWRTGAVVATGGANLIVGRRVVSGVGIVAVVVSLVTAAS